MPPLGGESRRDPQLAIPRPPPLQALLWLPIAYEMTLFPWLTASCSRLSLAIAPPVSGPLHVLWFLPGVLLPGVSLHSHPCSHVLSHRDPIHPNHQPPSLCLLPCFIVPSSAHHCLTASQVTEFYCVPLGGDCGLLEGGVLCGSL